MLPGHGPRFDCPRCSVQIMHSQGGFQFCFQPVKRCAETIGDHMQTFVEQAVQPAHPAGIRLCKLVRGGPETHGFEHDLRRGIVLKIRDFQDMNMIDPPGQGTHRQWYEITHPARIETGGVKTAAAALAGIVQTLNHFGSMRLRVHVPDHGDDVLSSR